MKSLYSIFVITLNVVHSLVDETLRVQANSTITIISEWLQLSCLQSARISVVAIPVPELQEINKVLGHRRLSTWYEVPWDITARLRHSSCVCISVFIFMYRAVRPGPGILIAKCTLHLQVHPRVCVSVYVWLQPIMFDNLARGQGGQLSLIEGLESKHCCANLIRGFPPCQRTPFPETIPSLKLDTFGMNYPNLIFSSTGTP